VSRY